MLALRWCLYWFWKGAYQAFYLMTTVVTIWVVFICHWPFSLLLRIELLLWVASYPLFFWNDFFGKVLSRWNATRLKWAIEIKLVIFLFPILKFFVHFTVLKVRPRIVLFVNYSVRIIGLLLYSRLGNPFFHLEIRDRWNVPWRDTLDPINCCSCRLVHRKRLQVRHGRTGSIATGLEHTNLLNSVGFFKMLACYDFFVV